jgi:hypothetical protein
MGLPKQTNLQILAILGKYSEFLAGVQTTFQTIVSLRNRERRQPIEVTSFYEMVPFPGVGVVSQTSCYGSLL